MLSAHALETGSDYCRMGYRVLYRINLRTTYPSDNRKITRFITNFKKFKNKILATNPALCLCGSVEKILIGNVLGSSFLETGFTGRVFAA